MTIAVARMSVPQQLVIIDAIRMGVAVARIGVTVAIIDHRRRAFDGRRARTGVAVIRISVPVVGTPATVAS